MKPPVLTPAQHVVVPRLLRVVLHSMHTQRASYNNALLTASAPSWMHSVRSGRDHSQGSQSRGRAEMARWACGGCARSACTQLQTAAAMYISTAGGGHSSVAARTPQLWPLTSEQLRQHKQEVPPTPWHLGMPAYARAVLTSRHVLQTAEQAAQRSKNTLRGSAGCCCGSAGANTCSKTMCSASVGRWLKSKAGPVSDSMASRRPSEPACGEGWGREGLGGSVGAAAGGAGGRRRRRQHQRGIVWHLQSLLTCTMRHWQRLGRARLPAQGARGCLQASRSAARELSD